jgi:hypothetical protein
MLSEEKAGTRAELEDDVCSAARDARLVHPLGNAAAAGHEVAHFTHKDARSVVVHMDETNFTLRDATTAAHHVTGCVIPASIAEIMVARYTRDVSHSRHTRSGIVASGVMAAPRHALHAHCVAATIALVKSCATADLRIAGTPAFREHLALAVTLRAHRQLVNAAQQIAA